MRPLFLVLVMSAAVSAQTPPSASPAATQPAAAPVPVLTLPATVVLGTVDGQRVTAGDVQTVLRGLGTNPARQQQALRDPRALLQQFGLLRRLASMAEKSGLDQQSPYREELAYNRMWTLAQAQLQATQSQITVAPEDVQKYYDANLDRYTVARVKVIYIPFSPTPSAKQDSSQKKTLGEEEAKAKADKLYAELQSGADFVKMVQEHSGDAASAAKEGDFAPIHRSDRIPEEIKTAIFALKPGQITHPLAQPNGFYIFRAEEITTEPFEKVRESIESSLRGSRMNDFMLTTQNSIEITIDNPAAFGLEPPAPAK